MPLSPVAPSVEPNAHTPADLGRQSGRPAQIVAVGLLDGSGHPLTEFRAGHALRVAIDFENGDAVNPYKFRVRVVREDGLVCCDLVTDHADPAQPSPDRGRLTLVLDRLDLNSGRYGVDVAAYAGDAPGGGDLQTPGCPLVVLGDSVREAVLAVPHRWELDSYRLAPHETARQATSNSSVRVQ